MAIDYSVLPLSKGPRRKTLKARKQRAETLVTKMVRALCVVRDGYCRFGRESQGGDFKTGSALSPPSLCDGPSEWAHRPERRRSKTIGMPPEERHDTKHTLMLCREHHAQLDGRARPRLIITALTRKGADGPLKFRRKLG